MYRLGTCRLDRLHHFINHDIGLVRWWWADVDRFVCHFNVQCIAVSIRINRNGFDAHFAGCLNHAAGDFATVSNQNFIEHVSVPFLFGLEGVWEIGFDQVQIQNQKRFVIFWIKGIIVGFDFATKKPAKPPCI